MLIGVQRANQCGRALTICQVWHLFKFHSSQVLGVQQAAHGNDCANTGATNMTHLITKFFTKKLETQEDDNLMQAEAALQIRVARMLRRHIAAGDVSVSPQMIRAT
jgi:hypothetical protein